MTAGELRAITVSGGLVWSASPVRLVTEDGRSVSVVEHRIAQSSETTDTGANRLTGAPVLTLVVRVDPEVQQPVADTLRNPLVGAQPRVTGGVSDSLVESGR